MLHFKVSMISLFTHNKKYQVLYITIIISIAVLIYLTLFQSTPKTPIPKVYPKYHSERIEGQISVKFKQSVTEEQINQDLVLYNAKIINTIPQIHRLVIQVHKDQTDVVLDKLSQDGLIAHAEPDYIQHQQDVVNDPLYKNQWYLKNTGQVITGITATAGTPGADISIEQAWAVTKGKGVKVGMVDGGADPNHPDLAGKIFASKAFGSLTSTDDENGHGTNTSGIVAANTNNGIGVAGVCPECQLIIARAIDKDGNADVTAVSQAIIWAADQGAQVINMSVGGIDSSQTQQDAVNYAIQKGAILVGSSGNCGQGCTDANGNPIPPNPINYPAAFAGVVSVSSTDNKDQRNPISTVGTWVKVTAPGINIDTTCPTHNFTNESQGFLKNYCYNSGTSMAAPIVSGVLALILSTGVSRDAAIQRLYDTADKISGTPTFWQYGRVNAGRAVGLLPSPQPTTNTPIPTIPNGTAQSLSLTVFLHGIGQGGDNANPQSGGNPTPTHTTRTIQGIFITATNQPLPPISANFLYDATAGAFKGTFATNSIPPGDYILKISSPGFLTRQVGGVIRIVANQSITAPSIKLSTGDITLDNKSDALDYQAISDCFGAKLATCTYKNTADLNDNGKVDGVDYNLFIRELSVQVGD